MSTLDTFVKDYDKNIVLRDCQRQAFEYLHDKKGDLLVTTFGTTFETFTEIESLQGPTTLYGRLLKPNELKLGRKHLWKALIAHFVPIR